ncbi:tRNA-specific adenosine deaminase 2 [Procambarus clarkii]|uniref:tRNA-specific adenosine deaminase 2 n=1 Tax=Procambarus clarkii TaxID=6728 RepID=UPI001E67736E|nr:tRNA-specific adenosine deaminase 2-like [Procambarus clarkii]
MFCFLTEPSSTEFFTFKMIDEIEDRSMSEAFSQAKEALACGEVPVGCVFVFNNEIIARGRNTVNQTHNATRHAEMNCIDQALTWCTVQQLDYRTVFPKISIFVTVEPCGMCADALGQLCVMNIIYGCSNDRFGGCGSVVDIPKLYKYPMKLQKGVRAEEAINLLKEFYKGENPNAPTGKAKRKTKMM